MKPAANCTIQIVDDHHMMRVGLKTSTAELSSLKVQWIESGTMCDALEQYREQGDIDLVLLDLNLPDSQGLQSLQMFKEQFPQAKLAVFSATEDEFVARQVLSMGALGLVPKSGAAQTTVRLVEALLARAQAKTGDAAPLGVVTVRAADAGALSLLLAPLRRRADISCT